MASRQRTRAPKKERTKNQLADLGIFNIPDFDNSDLMDDENASDVDETALESELEAILSGKVVNKPPRSKNTGFTAPLDIETMAAECMKDIEENDDDDDNLLTDPDLLRELKALSPDTPDEESVLPSKKESNIHVEVSEEKEKEKISTTKTSGGIVTLLEDRLKLYNEAVAAAKVLNDNSKARRYSRAVKTLEQLLKSAKANKNINEEDIPPVVSIPKARARPPPEPELQPELHSRASPETENVPENLIDFSDNVTHADSQIIEKVSPDISDVMRKRDQYKMAALQAKRAGDKATALNYMKTLKTLDAIIAAVKNGEGIDLTNLPPSPKAIIMTPLDHPKKECEETQTSSSSIEAAALSAASEPEDPTLFAAPPAPTTILDALNQRLEKYKSTKESAAAEGNSSKVRRLERIIKSYEKAVKDFKAGKTVNFEELANPPGFAPIPVPKEMGNNAIEQVPVVPPRKSAPEVPSSRTTPEVPSSRSASEVSVKRPAPEVPQKNTQPHKPVRRSNASTHLSDKQLDFLLEYQKMFRQAAIRSKKEGDFEQAKNYLRKSKGFDSMIEATKCGLPIDASSIPTPPQLETDFVVVDIQDCVEDNGNSFELLESLENDLVKQIEVCSRNKEHFLKLGDVHSASKFEKLGLESRKDLSVICHLKRKGQSPPKFHYETRLFSVVQCNTDLSDSQLQVTVERGVNLPGKPDDLDSYVKLDLPIPSADTPQRAKTHTVRDTNNPIFQEEFTFEINRKSRAVLRQFKRGILKLEVWSKGGFFRSDTLLGTANIKLVDLETKCNVHDSFDLMEGRKACGGKLEVKIRIRHPLLAKQVEEVREKWLVIES